MALNPESKYPNRRSYVLKLRGDAKAEALSGGVENIATGERQEFGSADELIDSLVRDLDAGSDEAAANGSDE